MKTSKDHYAKLTIYDLPNLDEETLLKLQEWLDNLSQLLHEMTVEEVNKEDYANIANFKLMK